MALGTWLEFLNEIIFIRSTKVGQSDNRFEDKYQLPSGTCI